MLFINTEIVFVLARFVKLQLMCGEFILFTLKIGANSFLGKLFYIRYIDVFMSGVKNRLRLTVYILKKTSMPNSIARFFIEF